MQNDHDIKKDGETVAKKGKKFGIVGFILCLLISLVIWCYAEAQAKKEAAEETGIEVVVQTDGAGDVQIQTEEIS